MGCSSARLLIHHIIHQTIKNAAKLFEYLGLDIHSAENRMTLPADLELTTRGLTKMVQHIGRHENKALRPIQAEVDNITRALENNTMSK